MRAVWALDVSGRVASGACAGAVYAALAAHPRGREVRHIHASSDNACAQGWWRLG